MYNHYNPLKADYILSYFLLMYSKIYLFVSRLPKESLTMKDSCFPF